MKEKIISIVEEVRARGIVFQIAETLGEFGPHYVLFTNGMPGFHSVDLERVSNYMHSYTDMMKETK